MICSFCGYSFDVSEGKRGCGNCFGGCKAVHCPRCNYKNPEEPALIRKIKSVRKKDKDET
ncbi:MAG: hypothetical protein FWD70_05265 [Desulfuromonadales bacterium]|nr:hypothetical protein [Desulfuromonadales bacterium]